MNIKDVLDRNCIAIDLKISSKKQLIQEMAQLMVDCGCLKNENIQVRDITSAAMERERLGSTGVGSGVALPHARIAGLKDIHISFARLETAVEFEAIDDRPVDLIVMILAPEDAGGDHLRTLAMISRKLRKEDIRARLRSAPDADSIYTTLSGETQANAA